MKSPPAEALPLPEGAATSHDWSSSLAVNSERVTLPPPPLLPLRVRWWWCCASGGLLDPAPECSDRVHCLLDDGGEASAVRDPLESSGMTGSVSDADGRHLYDARVNLIGRIECCAPDRSYTQGCRLNTRAAAVGYAMRRDV
jgi:hypothetical protein